MTQVVPILLIGLGGFLIGGVTGFGAGYILGALMATDSGVRGNDVGFVPVIGPFIAAATLEHIPSGGFIDFDFSSADRAFFILSGVLQTGGVVLSVIAFTAPKKLYVRGEAPVTGLTLVPAAGPGFAGFNLIGSM